MGFLDFLHGSGGKSLGRERLNNLLNQISSLSPEEKEYVKNIFAKYQTNGISRSEAERAIRQLKMNYSDSIDSFEMQKIKEKILGFFN